MILTLESEAVEQLKRSVTDAVIAELHAVLAPVRWVGAAEYARYYSISSTTLWRREKALRSAGALVGKGKRRRFDKYFKPFIK